ncbi:hypothetical protein [Pseudomonas abieticivorans]|uniref:hypothetical protein n=1 Tax=Pseudomonas abieticivorans TaxID=2931382 RepID=UPI0020BFFE3D|nr:hypothetical protein [Pseudomonas sp. PIA16]
MQSKVDVAVMIGSGVPPSLRTLGKRICWVVLVNGEQRGTAFADRADADECRAAWLAELASANLAVPARHAC